MRREAGESPATGEAGGDAESAGAGMARASAREEPWRRVRVKELLERATVPHHLRPARLG